MPDALSPESADAIVKSLSFHGAFLKKHVVKAIREAGVGIIGEEIPLSFAHHLRAADVIARDQRNLFLVIECKKVAAPKSWVFVRDMDDYYRVSRKQFGRIGMSSSINSRRPFPETPVCSDAYQYDPNARPKPEQPAKRATTETIHEAAAQLCGVHLGFVERRVREIAETVADFRPDAETYVPLLVTNARLRYINVNDIPLDTATGELLAVPEVFDVPHVVLNFPFASPTEAQDFRRNAQGEDWKLRFQESLYVVNVNHLTAFLHDVHRRTLVEAESEKR